VAKRVYVGPHDEVEVAATGDIVRRGEAVDVPEELAQQLDEQPDNWAKPTTRAAKDASAPPPAPPQPAVTFDGHTIGDSPDDGEPLDPPSPTAAPVHDVPPTTEADQ
jgi:hypothetical protein